MFSVRIRSKFSSAHNLRGYKGACEDLHGHNWRVEAEVSGVELDDLGMLMDFKDLKKELAQVLSSLDHAYLNDVAYFREKNPTSENIARYIFKELSPRVGDRVLQSVTVWETDTSSATYSPCAATGKGGAKR
ncbi:MAG: 6-carboxytetrahydropterin synthase QueD [Candidatus Omnitrophica bacterium]|nr:6-carboxytetrahydropterin synthase QueD [Candidatus Omnitrophota bacterium]